MNLLKMSDIPGREITWAWDPYIPFGKVTNIFGDPNVGQAYLALAIIAAMTRGHALPRQESPNVPVHVLLQTPENGLNDVVRPRLEQCGADCDLIHVLPFGSRCEDSNMHVLEEAINETGAKLFVLDPLELYLHNSDGEEYFSCVRRFSHLAASRNCAVVLVSDELPISIQEVMHSLLTVGLEDSRDKYLRGMSHVTPILGGNVDDYGSDVLFRIHPKEGFQWVGLKSTPSE